MKTFRKILLWTFFTLLLLVAGIWLWMRSSAPDYDGQIKINGLTEEVNTWFDDFGIPHIEAQNKHDMYLAFGYLHAQDRLFQMELLRRAGGGRLAEMLGPQLVKTDVMFRTLGLTEYAEQSAALLLEPGNAEMLGEINAYLEGINQFIINGSKPPELSILGIDPEPFTTKDLFLITGAMAFSFSQAQKTDFILGNIAEKFGDEYLRDLAVYHDSTESFIPFHDNRSHLKIKEDSTAIVQNEISKHLAESNNTPDDLIAFASGFAKIENQLPFAPLNGSNSWVVGGSKTKSQEVIFCNDTHIGYLIPQTWYEAQLTCPGFEIYGHFMAGVPFALIGRNQKLSWGLTMLLNDDMDFYREKIKPDYPYAVQFQDHWVKMDTLSHRIKIKGEKDTMIIVRKTQHGPLINDIFDGMGKLQPLSMSWTYTRIPNRTMEAFHGMNNATDFESFEKNLHLIHAPGLNVNYGDVEGNYAWWACAKLVKRPSYVRGFTIADGTMGLDEELGYYDFSENPRSVNPEWGYIYSANDWPEMPDSSWYPGYYKPQYRADRINKLLSAKNDWDVETMKSVMNDAVNEVDSLLLAELIDIAGQSEVENDQRKILDDAQNWNGEYDPSKWEPTLYNLWLYNVMKLTCTDEMGKESFELWSTGHQYQRAYSYLLKKENSPWWNNVNTEQKESRHEIVLSALSASCATLKNSLGNDHQKWFWKSATSLELQHPFGRISLLRPLFNVGPHPVWGGNETILQSGFKPDSTGMNKVYFGSQMRIIFDFGDGSQGVNVSPCGQSGHLMSRHYSDQAELYRNREFRSMIVDSSGFKRHKNLKLVPGM